jgi:hypothetical protein
MTDETIAALEWAARCADQFAAEQRPLGPSANLAANEKRAALIRALIERDKQPPIVHIDPAQYEDGLYLNPITGAVMWIAIFPPV